MDDEPANQESASACKFQMNLSEELRKFRQLLSAVKQGHQKIVGFLLEEGACVNRHPVWYELQTPLHSAVRLGDPDIVARLLSKGACVNAKYSDETPLILAAKLEKLEIVDLLLSAKSLKNCADENRMTHFHVACMRNQVEVAKTLLQYEITVNIAVNSDSHYWPGFTALHFAVRSQNIETVDFLLKAGADITIKDARQLTPLHLAHELGNGQIVDLILLRHNGIISNPVDSKGLSHFHIACTRNEPNIVEHFIEIGVNLRDPVCKKNHASREMAIDLAIQHECTDVLRLLLQYWVPKFSDTFEEHNRITDAYRAVNLEIVDLLMTKKNIRRKSRKSKINFLEAFSLDEPKSMKEGFCHISKSLNSPVTLTGCTLLHSAIECGSRKVIKFLMGKDVDFTVQDIRGKSPLHLAFEHNMTKLVDLMLTDRKFPPKNIADNNGLSHLHIACARNNVKVVESLLKLGANVNGSVNINATFWSGFGPLHFAAKFGSVEVTQVLLKYGASYSATNASNLSAFDIALVEANKNHDDSDSAVACMKLILTFHTQCKDKLFNDRGFSLLHLASIKTYCISTSTVEELGQLLNTHAGDVNKSIHKMGTSWDCYTPLHFALRNLDTIDHAKLLIQAGADLLSQDSNGDTPIHLSTTTIDFEITVDPQDSRFLQLNHVGTTTGLSLFQTACARGYLDLMKYYLERGADPNRPSLAHGLGCEDQAPLHLVLANGVRRIDAVKLLLEYGADPNVRDHQKNTPLHLMRKCFWDHEIIEILVSHGADVNARNAQFETPLLSLVCALENDNSFCGEFIRHIDLFLKNGSSIDLADERGKTVLEVAKSWIRKDPNDLLFGGSFSRGYSRAFDIIDIMMRHIIRLERLGIKLKRRANKKLYSSFIDLCDVESTYPRKCNNELELMKNTQIEHHITLHDILLGKLNQLAGTSQSIALQNLVNSNDLSRKYPLYGPMLKLRLIQGQVRWRLLKESIKPLNSLLRIRLPQNFSQNILQYLNNDDLRNIISLKKNSS